MKRIALPVSDGEVKSLAVAVQDLEMSLADPENRLGATCPCCGQTARVYKRPLYGGMCSVLRWLSEQGTLNGLPQKPTLVCRGGDYSKLRFFGLAEEVQHGYWKITPLGEEFLRGRATVRSHVWVFDGRVVGVPEDARDISIREVKNLPFKLDDVLDGRDLPVAAE